jgi:hypothetical protein
MRFLMNHKSVLTGDYKRHIIMSKPENSFFAFISGPARRALESANIKTLEDLAEWTEHDLLKLHGLGPGTIPKLRKELKDKGLSFRS